MVGHFQSKSISHKSPWALLAHSKHCLPLTLSGGECERKRPLLNLQPAERQFPK